LKDREIIMRANPRLTMPKIALTWALIALMSVIGLVEAPSAAHAATPSGAVRGTAASISVVPKSSVKAAPKRLSALQLVRIRGARIVAAAGAQRGKPYRLGAQGPKAFDCSGLSGYAYRAVHIRLPRTANQQYHAARRISRAAARPGDLVFWVSGKHAYHVAIYAGSGRIWHAPKPGDRVHLAKIFSPAQTRFGRIGA
jgi:cell wall-associated NlpC family hydrolase